MIKTYKDLQNIDEVVGGLYRKDPTLEQTKFGYAYKRFVEKNYIPVMKELRELLVNARIDLAMEDPKTKEVLTDPNPQSRGFRYDKEGLKAIIQKEKEIMAEFDKKEIEVTPFISSFVPEGLTDEDKEMLKGCVIE